MTALNGAGPAASISAEPRPALAQLGESLRSAELRPLRGRITHAVGTIIHAIVPDVRIGELCRLVDERNGFELSAEVVGLAGETAILTPIGDMQGLSARAHVIPTRKILEAPVGEGLLGRVVDCQGAPLDNRGPIHIASVSRPLHAPAPNPMSRQIISRPMSCGIRAIDGPLTCGEGQRIGIFGEPGGGKSSLLAQIVNGASADICIIALIGERGREVREFIEHQLGATGLARSIVVVATSDRSAMERVKAAYLATAAAEYFRDKGRRVLLLMDSVTRFARALREIGLAAGEPPTRRGFPPSVFASLPMLMERAGPGETGSITAFYTVLVEGDGGAGDPIAEETRSILDGHIVLSRRLASSGHYPAIDVLASRSRVMDAVVSKEHRTAANRLRLLMARYQDTEFLIQVGEYKAGSDAVTDEAVKKSEPIRAFLRQDTQQFTTFQETDAWMKRLTG
jgi:ATP synthase in type III secretion protein N